VDGFHSLAVTLDFCLSRQFFGFALAYVKLGFEKWIIVNILQLPARFIFFGLMNNMTTNIMPPYFEIFRFIYVAVNWWEELLSTSGTFADR